MDGKIREATFNLCLEAGLLLALEAFIEEDERERCLDFFLSGSLQERHKNAIIDKVLPQ